MKDKAPFLDRGFVPPADWPVYCGTSRPWSEYHRARPLDLRGWYFYTRGGGSDGNARRWDGYNNL